MGGREAGDPQAARTPFREAIGILAKGGLVEIKPYRGLYVRSFLATRLRTFTNYTSGWKVLRSSLPCRKAIPISSDLKIYLLNPWSPCSVETRKHALCGIGNFTKILPSNREIPRSLRRSRDLRCKSRSCAIKWHKLAPFFAQLTPRESGSCRGSCWQASHLEALSIGYEAAHQTLF